MKRAYELIFQVNKMLDEEILDAVQQLEFIDDLQRLCLSYHFEDKIKHILNRIYLEHKYNCKNYEMDLYSTALEFRLLRQHGFRVSQDVFDCFKNDKGDFKSSHGEDTKGLLQLYEASFLLTQGEKTLELAKEFASNFLKKKLEDDEGNIGNNIHDEHLSSLWRVPRVNARWCIDEYEKRQDMKPIVLELAKLDFNIVQATNQQELKHLSRWWKQTSLVEMLPFARDRLVECYLWTVGGLLFEPQNGHARIMVAKVNALITVIDYVFDVYGTLEELQAFNNAIQRWDIEAMDKLPNYMQICFLALNNFIDEVAYHVLREQGFLIILHLRKSVTLLTPY
ncbi:hypothetical protein DH2020_011013 [Rehmannia glutinosa]|uniref:Uncharacterized protein n=1 Tax=Rehmannia glutinosa TaxID=99300 RepID=A0ABR0XC57_REHGL